MTSEPRPLAFKPDYPEAKRRIDAWWDQQVLDRALVYLRYPRPDEECYTPPERTYDSDRARWLDLPARCERLHEQMANWVHYADSIPVATCAIGPATFAAVLGCPLEFGPHTTWTEPMLTGWDAQAVRQLALDPANEYYRVLVELHRMAFERGRGKYLVGLAPQLGGGDTLAAIRGSEAFCMDLIEHADEVPELVDHLAELQCQWYDVLWQAAGGQEQPVGGWLGMIADGRFYIPQNDFSAMVSPAMFSRFLLGGTVLECRHMDRCIYHLDGLQALNHLDAILEVPEIDAVQWGPPPQHWDWHEWVEVYRRIQAAGKSFILYCKPEDLREVTELFRPEGAWLHVDALADKESADAALEIIRRWK